MKILFTYIPVYPKYNLFSMNTMPSTALYLLTAILRDKGFSVDVLDPFIINKYCSDLSISSIKKLFDKYITDVNIICMSNNTTNWAMTKYYIKILKKIYPEIKIIIGGIHSTYFHDYIINTTNVDFIVRGEGEKKLPMLLEEISNNNLSYSTPGVTYKINDKIYMNDDSLFLEKNDFLNSPIPAYDLMPSNVYYLLPIETSRGCKFGCSFCSIERKKDWIGFNEDFVIERSNKIIKMYLSKFKQNNVYITDDCFTVDGKRCKKIIEGLNTSNNINLTLESRATDLINNENTVDLIDVFKMKIISRIATGVECGYDYGLKKIKKGLTIELLNKSMKILDENKLMHKSYYSFIVGFPWENLDDCIKTIDYAASIIKKYKQKNVNVNWLQLLPSLIWDEQCSINNKLNPSIFDHLDFFTNEKFFFETHPNIDLNINKFVNDYIINYKQQGICLQNP